MPFYAYIKIPGVEKTESRDLYYGNGWIPLESYELSGDPNKSITAKPRRGENKDQKNKKTQNQMLSMMKRRKEVEYELSLLADGTGGVFGELESNAWQDALDEVLAEEAEIAGKSTITIDKLMDASSPKLHQFCLEYLRGGDHGTFLKGKVELHICRVVEKGNGEQTPELFMAYLLENCGISSVNIDASESSSLTETVEIDFQQITTATNFDGTGWISKGWDMVRGEEKSTDWKPNLPSPS
jgi:type VI protein secretion system component Hcp